MLIFHQPILLIACEPSLNLITNYLICVAGKQWEALRFTIEVSTCMVRCLIAHYCAIAGTILIFRFLIFWSCTCRYCYQRFWPTVQPFLHRGKWVVHEYQSNQETQKIVRIKKLATKNKKIFVCTMKKTSVHYKMVLTIIPCLFLFLCPISNIEKIFMHILVFRVHWWLPLKPPLWSGGEESFHTTPTVQYWSVPEEVEGWMVNHPQALA